MIIRILIASGLAAGLMVSTANAVTIHNMDKTAHDVMFTPKGGHALHRKLAAKHNRNEDCTSGGTFSLGKSTLKCNASTAHIWIKSGKLSDKS